MFASARTLADGDLAPVARAIAVAPIRIPCSASPTGWILLAHKAGLAAHFGVSTLAVRELAAASQQLADENDDPLVVVLSSMGLALFRRGVRSRRVLPLVASARLACLEGDLLVAWLYEKLQMTDGGQRGLYLRLLKRAQMNALLHRKGRKRLRD